MTNLTLETIVANGQAAYLASFPDFARGDGDEPETETTPNVSGVTEERQIELCLNCVLPDCVGVDHRRCPIRQEQLRIWREKKKRH